MKLLKLLLENFQGIKSLALDFDGNDATIYGDNATGKTTVYNAYTYLLFEKASTDAKNFTPKTRSDDGFLHNLDHAVEGVFRLNNGQIITYKKVYKEVYRKVRGTAQEEFSGHKTDYYIDGVPTSKAEYENSIAQFIGEGDIPKMLSKYNHFPEIMHWAERRSLLIDICGDVTDQDVIDSNKDLKGLADYLLKPGTGNQYYTVDDYKKIASAQKVSIKRCLDEIPSRIDEATKAIPDLQGQTLDNVKQQQAAWSNQKNILIGERNNKIGGDAALNAVKKELLELMSAEAEAKMQHIKRSTSKNDYFYEQIRRLNEEKSAIEYKIRSSDGILVELNIATAKRLREELATRFAEISATKWNESEAVCPTCNRELPEDKVQELKEKFNLSRSQKLEEINKRGKAECSKEIISELEARLVEIDKKYADLFAKKEELIKQIDEMQKKIIKAIPFEQTEEYATMQGKIVELEKQAKDIEAGVFNDNKDIDDKINEVADYISKLEEIKQQFGLAEKQKQRIKELEKEEKDLAKSYQHIEKGLYLCELFLRHKVLMIDTKINKKFNNVRFQLFKEQVNGGLQEDCEVLVPAADGSLVTYSADANSAARINAGLEIIDVLSDYFNIRLPLFVDNAEAVTKLQPIGTQVIRLVVSEQDKKLRLEVTK